MSASNTFGGNFVGAGHNALIVASYLSTKGRSVCLLDRPRTPGGWVHSEELSLWDSPTAVEHAEQVTPDVIMPLGLAFWGSKTLLSAVELGCSR